MDHGCLCCALGGVVGPAGGGVGGVEGGVQQGPTQVVRDLRCEDVLKSLEHLMWSHLLLLIMIDSFTLRRL